MRGHLSGKRHTRAVARRFYVTSRRAGIEPEPPLMSTTQLGSNTDATERYDGNTPESVGPIVSSTSSYERWGSHKQGTTEGTHEYAARDQRRRLFEQHSSEPLRRHGWAEPPDVALMLLHNAIDKFKGPDWPV